MITAEKSTPTAATVEATVALRKTSTATSWRGTEIVPLRIHLLRVRDAWTVDRITFVDGERAEALVSASSAQRDQMLIENSGNLSSGLARALYDRALELLNGGKFAEARTAATLARQIANEAGDAATESLASGLAVYVEDDHTIAAAQWDESMVLATRSGDPDALARAWYNRGRLASNRYWVSRRASVVNERMECYRTAASQGEHAEDPTIRIRALYSLANIAANSQSDYISARRHIDASLQLARETHDHVGQMGAETVLAAIYFGQRDLDRGFFHNQRAVELARQHQLYGYPALVIRAAAALVDAERFDEARSLFARAISRDATGALISTAGPVTPSILGNTLRSFAIMEAHAGNLAEAECLTRQSARYFKADNAAFLHDIAGYHLKYDNPAAALSLAFQSLQSEASLYPPQKISALLTAAEAYRRLGFTMRGLALAEEAIDLRESIASRVHGSEQQQVQSGAETANCYEVAAEISLDRADVSGALAFLESGRARVLTDIIANGRPGLLDDIDRTHGATLASLEREVTQWEQRLAEARTGQADAAAVIQSGLAEARAVYASFEDGVRNSLERRRQTRRGVEPQDLPRLAAKLPPGAVAIEFFVGEDQLYVFTVRRDSSGRALVRVQTVPVGRAVLQKRVATLAASVSTRMLRWRQHARDMYALLLGPIDDVIRMAHALVIIPDKFLWDVPFAALIDSRNRMLIERSAVVYAPSLSAFVTLNDRVSGSRGAIRLLAIGNPTIDLQTATDVTSSTRPDLRALPDAETEVEALRDFYARERAIVLKGKNATEAKTKALMPEAAIIHFATHGVLDDANPIYSRLALGVADEQTDNGWLEGWEVAKMNLTADVVVLSACESAGSGVGGEGVVGMAWSFLLAGARSTVAARWRVSSSSTALLMISFHRALQARPGDPSVHKAQALRAAQLELLQDPRTRHPYYWAPFILLGNASWSATPSGEAVASRSLE
ncbi:MAG TPA: CHAT domain-containing protein [Thermoanaerobaculia bacterium]|nr:CHAT domain-containing protein [Thermoanaerobaculia bacterium]